MVEVIKVEDCVNNIGDYDIPIHNAIIIPKGATNGNIFCLFNNVSRVIELRDCVEVEVEVRPSIIWTSQFDKEWWKAPYKGEE